MKTRKILDSYINAYAYLLSKLRRLGDRDKINYLIDSLISSNEEEINDWNSASSFVTLQILEGNIPFNQIDPDSYEILENVWEKDVKLLKAYFIWNDKKRTGSMDENYAEASKGIRTKLFSGKEYPLEDFDNIRKYIEKRYLGADGKIDETKEATHRLIAHKAERIYQNTGNPDDKANWFRAKLYVRFFYENIIPAVENSDSDKINNVLNAFEFSKSPQNRFLIINSFEAAIAIYFLDKDLIKLITLDPESYGFNMVQIHDWPNNFTSPSKKFRYDLKVNLITYVGAMSPEERNNLINKIPETNHQKEIEELFEQSNLKPYPAMIL